MSSLDSQPWVRCISVIHTSFPSDFTDKIWTGLGLDVDLGTRLTRLTCQNHSDWFKLPVVY